MTKCQSVTTTYRQPSVWTQSLAWQTCGRPGLANLQNQCNFHHLLRRVWALVRKIVLVSLIPFLCLVPAGLYQSSKALCQFHQPWKKHLLLHAVQQTKYCNTTTILHAKLSQHINFLSALLIFVTQNSKYRTNTSTAPDTLSSTCAIHHVSINMTHKYTHCPLQQIFSEIYTVGYKKGANLFLSVTSSKNNGI